MRVIFLPGWKLAKVSRGICVCIEDEANLKYWSWFSLEKFSVFTVSWRLHIFIPRSSSFQREGKENQVRIIFSPGNKVAKSNTKFGTLNPVFGSVSILYLFTLGNLNLSDKLWELKKFFSFPFLLQWRHCILLFVEKIIVVYWTFPERREGNVDN